MDNFDLKKYLANNPLTEAYTPGSGWTEDFEYDDMMAHGLTLTADDSIEDLRKVAEDFTDVNYHREAAHLYDAIDAIEAGDRGEAKMYINKFRKEIKATLSGWGDVNEAQASDLMNDGVVLYASDDSKLAPGFVEPKNIGFIVYNITGNLSKNEKVIDIFSDNYPNTDPNYITTFFTDSKNWKAITSKDELNNFTKKYSKVYLINPNGDSSQLNEVFNPFLDTTEGGYMREYIDGVAEEEGLDLDYRDEFDMAFNSALTKLKNDYPELDFEAIKANKESFF